jgi:hypothetical protein
VLNAALATFNERIFARYGSTDARIFSTLPEMVFVSSITRLAQRPVFPKPALNIFAIGL